MTLASAGRTSNRECEGISHTQAPHAHADSAPHVVAVNSAPFHPECTQLVAVAWVPRLQIRFVGSSGIPPQIRRIGPGAAAAADVRCEDSMLADAAKGLAAAPSDDAAATAPAATGGSLPSTPAPAAGPPNPPCRQDTSGMCVQFFCTVQQGYISLPYAVPRPLSTCDSTLNNHLQKEVFRTCDQRGHLAACSRAGSQTNTGRSGQTAHRPSCWRTAYTGAHRLVDGDCPARPGAEQLSARLVPC